MSLAIIAPTVQLVKKLIFYFLINGLDILPNYTN